MGDFLLELLSEEVPAQMLEGFASRLKEEIVSRLPVEKLDNCQHFYTPRRVCIHIEDLVLTTGQSIEEIRGPRVGAPESALEGFMRKYSISDKSELVVRGEFYLHQRQINASEPKAIIKSIVEAALENAVWPKSMKWGSYQLRWVRPLHSIICMLDEEVIPIEFGHLKGSNFTVGHRFLSSGHITLASASITQYEDALKQGGVIVSQHKRKEIILSEVQKLIEGKGLELVEDEQLLNEIVNLVEYPVIYLGEISSDLMVLPEEVLTTTLKNNQRYLMLRDSSSRKLAPFFIIVSNMLPSDGGKEIINGNKRVLSARLLDALFFYQNDKTERLESRVEMLKDLTFHKEIGSVYKKVGSTARLARAIAEMVGTDSEKVCRAVQLMKADLVTEMVGEFPELQGVMGYYYALHDGEDEEVALAIREHYKPLGPWDSIPSSGVPAIVALAEKLDTLHQMFSIGIKPTGSKDPFALRRAANGVIRIISEHNLPIDIKRHLTTLGISDDVISYILEREALG